MTGQRISSKQKNIDKFADRIKIYNSVEPLNFDIRGYADYLKRHNITNLDEQKEVSKRFKNF